MAVFLVTYYQGTKKVGQTGPYATRRAAAADAKSMIRNHVGAGYPITELYTSTKTTGKPKMVAPQVMKKEKYADWNLYKETKRKRYDRKLPTNKVPEVAGYSAQGPKEGVLRASIESTTAAKWANSMKLKYNPAGKKHAVLLRRNGQMYGYFGPYTSKSLADADAAALKAMVPSSITVESSPVSQTRASTKKTTRRNAAPAAALAAVRGAKMVSKILPALYAARDYACTPAGRAAVEKAIQTVCKGNSKSKEQAAQAVVRNHNGHMIVGKSGAYVTTVDGKKGTVGHKTLAEAKKAIDNPRKNNPLVEFTTRAGRNVKFEASYTRSKPKKKVVAKKPKVVTGSSSYKFFSKQINDPTSGWQSKLGDTESEIYVPNKLIKAVKVKAGAIVGTSAFKVRLQGNFPYYGGSYRMTSGVDYIPEITMPKGLGEEFMSRVKKAEGGDASLNVRLIAQRIGQAIGLWLEENKDSIEYDTDKKKTAKSNPKRKTASRSKARGSLQRGQQQLIF
jgi:hypothetical protein